ncbi:MAG: ABC transporter substrate binding protein, partial [Gemmatimonadales bacterium]
MRRRTLLRATCAALLAPALAWAQGPKRLALFIQGADPSKALLAFRGRQAANLAARGWIEGKTLVLELHLVGRDLEGHLEGARRLVATRPDVIFTNTWFLTKALRAATTTIPIVAVIGDPVGAGLVTSLARPGGNITGISLAIDLAVVRQRELLQELMPRLATMYSL